MTDGSDGKIVEFPLPKPEDKKTESAPGPLPAAYAPILPSICWRSGFSEFRDAYTKTTEACDEFLFGAFLTLAGFALGRETTIGSLKTTTNNYICYVGLSGKSRKTTVQQFIVDTAARLQLGFEHVPGIGSAEGIIDALSGTPRMLLDIAEISMLLQKAKQDGTKSLIPMLTQLYDCPNVYRLHTRTNPVICKTPFLSIITASTPAWLKESLDAADIRGGFMGRFQILVGIEKSAIPWPPPPKEHYMKCAEGVLNEAKERHKGGRKYELSEGAMEIWDTWYRENYVADAKNEILNVIAVRLHQHAIKLACVYAGLEGAETILEEHITAACAYAEYQRKAQAFVFGDFDESKEVAWERSIFNTISRFQTRHGRPPRIHEIKSNCKHIPSVVFNRTLDAMRKSGTITYSYDGKSAFAGVSPEAPV